MAVLETDMQVEGRGTFLCLLGVCLIAIAAAAALLWSTEPRLSDHHRSGVRREVGVEPISCNEYSHFKLPAQSAANKHLNSATQHYLTFPWWFKWNCVARGTLVPVMDTHNFITLYRIRMAIGLQNCLFAIRDWACFRMHLFYWKEI